MRRKIVELTREKRKLDRDHDRAVDAYYARRDALSSELRRVEIDLENAEFAEG